MSKVYISILLALCLSRAQVAFSQQAMQDVGYLKNGAAVRGLTIEQMPNVSVEVQAGDGNVFVYKMDDVLNITKEFPVAGAWTGDKKSPVLAFVLSCLVPGAGQYYNGDITKGAIQQVLYAGGLTLGLYAAAGGAYGSDDNEAATWVWVGLGVAGASYLWSIIDAPISAIRINRERELSYGHLLEFNSAKQVIGFDLATNGKTIGAKLSMHF